MRVCFQARLVNLPFLLSWAFYQGLKVYYALPPFTCCTRTYKLETKHWACLRQFAKGKFMHMDFHKWRQEFQRVKFHQKLTSIITVALNKVGLKAKERLPKQLFNIKHAVLFKSVIQQIINCSLLTNCPPSQNKKIKNVLHA